jgi:hypothetical protein
MLRRIFCCFKVLFARHVIVLEATKDPRRKGYNVKLYGSMCDPPEEVHLLRKMADYVENGLTAEEREKLATLR